ncbi:hypothetical protein FQN55_004407 [Onygenales sp. PD_40]|nr:hypothetical protein FQN55_004407 [Onygenales sp. PD_40]
MGKRKRTKKKPLSQEEIWDDSALIQSWDEAVEEYNLYHSIQARGENVDDVLREEEARALAAEAAGDVTDEQPDAAQPELEANEDVEQDMAGAEKQPAGPSLHGDAASAKAETGATHPTGGFANMPHMVHQAGDASGSDEGLKNLMMAWYFAGYYTGLHEGQQRANQSS